MNQPEEKLKEEIEEALGQEYEWKEINEGLNTIYRLRSDGEGYILKVQTLKDDETLPYYKQDRSGRFRAEPMIYRLVNQNTSVPSPEVVYEDTTEQEYSRAFYVMEEIQGENAADIKDQLSLEELGEIIYQCGEILGEIHRETNLEQYGLLSSENGELTTWETSENWRETFEETLRETETVIEETWDEKPELNMKQALANLDYLPEHPQASLLHMDNRLENVVLENNNVIGFLDWNFTRAGHDELDLARTEYLLIDYELDLELGLDKKEKDQMREKLFEGYNETNTIDSGEEFEERRQLYRYSTVLWTLAGFPNWSSSWDEKARNEMEQELLERLSEEEP